MRKEDFKFLGKVGDRYYVVVNDVDHDAVNVKVDKFKEYFHVSYGHSLNPSTTTGFAFFFNTFGGRKKYPSQIIPMEFHSKIGESKLKTLVDELIETQEGYFDPYVFECKY